MRTTLVLILLGFTLPGILLSVNEAHGAGFIKFDGIDGESIDKDHKGWSELVSLRENFSGASVASKQNTNSEIIIVKNLDRVGPHLAESVATGKVFSKVVIDLCSDVGSKCVLSYELSNVMVTSYSINGTTNQIPTETISLNSEKLNRISVSASQTNMDKGSSDSKDKPISDTPQSTKGNTETKKTKVPGWVQTTAKFWIDKNVSDKEFTDALGFLVKEKIIDVHVDALISEKSQIAVEPQVPAWIAQTTDWWIKGQVPEDQFLEGIKWMITNKIIRGI